VAGSANLFTGTVYESAGYQFGTAFSNASPYNYIGSGTMNITGVGNVSAWWAQLQIPFTFNMTSYTLVGSWNNFIQNWGIVASNDGSTWIYIDNRNYIHTQAAAPAGGGTNTAIAVTNTLYYIIIDYWYFRPVVDFLN